MSVDTHVPRGPTQTLPFPVRYVLLRLGISILLGHTEVDDVYYVGRLGAWAANEEVVWLDVSVDEVLLVDGLYPGKLKYGSVKQCGRRMRKKLTICLATITTVLIENRRLQWSNRSSREGPSRSITRMLCKPSWPK